MILHLNVNIFECFWVLHNKEPVTKLSSTWCRLDIIIDAYRTGPREIKFMLLQFHWFKLKSYTKGLYHGKKKEVPVFMDDRNCVYLFSGSGWMCYYSCPGWAPPTSVPCAAVSLHQTSASSSIPGLRHFPCLPALCFTSCTPMALQPWTISPSQTKQNNTAYIVCGYFSNPVLALRPWTYHGFSAHNSGAVAGKAFSQAVIGEYLREQSSFSWPRQRND